MSAISDSSVAGKRFEDTAWSVVIAAGADSSPRAHHALAELCRVYWPPIYGYLRRHGYDAQDAQDLTQSFFQHMLEDETLRREFGQSERIYAIAEKFLQNFCSCVDNTHLNFTLDIPDMLQVEKF